MFAIPRDLRFAVRVMWKNRGFSAAVVLTMALAIGSTVAIATLVDATLVRGLPYPDAERLVQIAMTKAGAADRMEASYPTFLDWKERSTAFEFIAGYSGDGGIARFGAEPPRLVEGAVVTADFFRTFGVRPILGSDFAAGDEDPADKHTAVLSHALWQQQFGGRTDVIGTSFTLDGTPHTVLGVLPADFEFAPTAPAELYTPVERLPFQMRRNLHWLNVVGRVRPGISVAQATAELAAISARLGEQYPESNKDTGARIVTLREALLGDIQPVMVVLLLGVGMLLLIACVNVANLMLARFAGRQKEMAIRTALGAPRGRLVRQSLTEALILASLGAAGGMLVAQWAIHGLIAAIPASLLRFMPYLQDVQVNARTVVISASLALLTALFVGLGPALQVTRPRPQDVLGEDNRSTASVATHRLRALLLSAQVALAVVLLSGAFLTSRSLLKMLEQDPGFDTRRLAVLRVLLPNDRYPDTAAAVPAVRELQQRLAALPGIEGVGLTNRTPLQAGNTVRYRREHEPAGSAGEQPEASIRSVDGSYFGVLKARLVSGRVFEAADESGGPPVLIVNRTLAEREFAGQDAVGRRLVFTFAPDQPAREIVGVIEDVREGPLDASRQPALYTPLMRGGARVVEFVLRTSGDPEAQLGPAEQVLNQFDRTLLVLRRTTIEDMMADAPWVFMRRYPATLTSAYALAALALAAVGVFGMISYLVAQRTREIGVRVALGARPVDVFRLMIGHGLRPALAGTAAGILCSLALARLIGSLLFGVSAGDPVTYLLVPVIVIVTAGLAAFVPARRAMKLDPMAALQRPT